MPEEPPNIESNGDRPTRFGDGSQERDAKPQQPAKPGVPSKDFRIPASDGQLDTYQAEKELSRFVSEGTELPPELVEEQRAVLLRAGDVVADRFEVVKQLGFGGMGAVYHVRDRYTRQDRALKVMLPSLLKSDAARERFRSEVTISQKLSHENIVRVHDLAADQKRKFYFFTMELVEGRTLNRLLRERGGKLPLNEALDIVRQLCDALEYAHKHTIHRDLKPQNIMIRPDGSIKVLDFGLAKLMSPGRMTRSSMALGTAYYQAPEQSIHLSELDQRADIYSIGVMFYQMLTGEIPAGRFEPLARVVRGLPKQLSDIVERCLDPKPEGRPASTGALREALVQAVKVKRYKWLLFGIGAIAILALVVLAAQLGTVPGERSETELSPGASVPERPVQPESPPPSEESEPPLPESAPESSNVSVEPSATAAEASTARQAAVVAQQAARSAGAEDHALELWDEAVKQLKQAEAHDTLEAFDDAISGYETAANAFKEAETEAVRISGEMKVLEEAQRAMAVVKAEVEAFDAAQYAKVRYEQAVKAEEEAAAIADDRVAAATAYQKAAERYQLAVDETKQQGAAIVAAAKKGAEAAKEKADTADVKKYSAKELEDAQVLLDKAVNTGDFQEAKGLYEQSAAKFAEALDAAGKRKEAEAKQLAQAKADMEKAREAAQTAKAMIGADERKYAETEVAAGDKAWSSALDASKDYAQAEGFYAQAKVQYAKAIEVAPGRRQAAETARKAEEERVAREAAEEASRRAGVGAGSRAGETRSVDLGGEVSMELVWIPPGEFMMGSPSSETDRRDDETQHTVRITQGFWMGKYEVTQEQWQAVMGSNPSLFKGDRNLPVEQVSWNDCQEFVKKLCQQASATFRLPTEAEWEYACRAGTTTPFHFGETISTDLANYNGDYTYGTGRKGVYRKKTTPVGSFSANAWGQHDMHGNVSEWCEDWHGDYLSRAVTDPTGPSSGSFRVLRGGSWVMYPEYCRSANRFKAAPGGRSGDLGFRVALPAVQSSP